jgi:hypothetical protein
MQTVTQENKETFVITEFDTKLSKEAVIEIFKQKIIAAGKSATITEQEDGSIKMTIHS